MRHAVSRRLSTIASAWKNQAYIAAMVMPIVMVNARHFEWRKFTRDWKIPETRVGSTGEPVRVGQDSVLVNASTENHALGFEVPVEDVEDQRRQEATNQADIVGTETEATTDLLMLAQEQRVANIVQDTANYDTSLAATLSGKSQWSHADSNPVKAIKEALSKVPIRPNTLVIGQEAFDVLCMHPRVAKLVHANDGDVALASPEQIARAFNLDHVLVGQSFHNTANRGQDESLARVWGKHAALLRVERMPGTARNPKPCFGLTAMFGERMVSTWMNHRGGAMGVLEGKVAEMCKEIVISKEAGYLFKAAVA